MSFFNALKAFFCKYIIVAVLVLFVLVVFLVTDVITLFGYTNKRALAIIEDMFPTAQVISTERLIGDLFVHMQNDKGIDFLVVYEGKHKFSTNYPEALVKANLEQIQQNCPDGVMVSPCNYYDTEKNITDIYSHTYELYFDIDGEEYLKAAARYCVDVQEMLDFEYVKPSLKQNIDIVDYMFFNARFLNPETGKYEMSSHSELVYADPRGCVGYDKMLEYMKEAYADKDF